MRKAPKRVLRSLKTTLIAKRLQPWEVTPFRLPYASTVVKLGYLLHLPAFNGAAAFKAAEIKTSERSPRSFACLQWGHSL
jgi:hypothetical protein